MTPDERLLTPDEVAERLKLAPVTVGHMLRAGTLPGLKLGSLWRVRAADFDAFVVARSEAAAAARDARAAAAKGRRLAVQAKAAAKRGPRGKAKPAPAADPSAELDAEPPENREPTEAERVRWASLGVPDAESVYTPEYLAWLETQGATPTDPDEGGDS